jgi:hypothetical protein
MVSLVGMVTCPLPSAQREKHAFGSLEVASSSSHLKTHLDPCAPVTVMIKGEKKTVRKCFEMPEIECFERRLPAANAHQGCPLIMDMAMDNHDL